MLRLLRFLKPYVLLILLNILLLYVQANADLALPDYLSRIVNIGIQQSGVESAVQAAAGADAVVAVMGSMPFINGRENADRRSMDLAIGQEEVLQAVRAVNPRTILVLENSYPTTIGWAKENVPAILWTTHAGQETGHALADVLFGDRAPSGRLTQTWYRSTADLPDLLDYDVIGADRTYLYFRGAPLFPFGHGLGYTTFEYRRLRLDSPVIGPRGTVEVELGVVNTGRRAGGGVVQLYTRQLTSRVKQPLQALRGFQRVHLAPGEAKRVRFQLRAEDLAFWDVTRGRPVVEAALQELRVGRSAGDIRATARLAVLGEVIPPRDLGKRTRAEAYDAHGGTALLDESPARGTVVGATAAGDWIVFQKATAGRGAAGFPVRVSREAADGAQLTLTRDGAGAMVTGTPPGSRRGESAQNMIASRCVSSALTSTPGTWTSASKLRSAMSASIWSERLPLNLRASALE